MAVLEKQSSNLGSSVDQKRIEKFRACMQQKGPDAYSSVTECSSCHLVADKFRDEYKAQVVNPQREKLEAQRAILEKQRSALSLEWRLLEKKLEDLNYEYYRNYAE